jgi:ABC-type phosphate transport system substrate-binding protein
MKTLSALIVCLALGGAPASSFKVVVNAKSPVQTLTREKAAAYFLKKATAYPDGTTVLPVDQGEDSAVRKAFSQEVLKKSVTAVKAYWQQRIFSGRDLPPPEKASDEEVLAYVKANERAIGYVSLQADTGAVKVVTLSE